MPCRACAHARTRRLRRRRGRQPDRGARALGPRRAAAGRRDRLVGGLGRREAVAGVLRARGREAGCDAGEVAYVGDRVDNDVVPGRRRPAWSPSTSGAGRGATCSAAPSGARLRVDSLAELPEALAACLSSAIGLGVDAHAFADGVPLVLGGVRFEHPRGLAGHSDGDVIAHALTDALLGAAGLGDIGSLFPSDDERWRGADSLGLLRDAYAHVREAGWELVNADCVLVGEEPRIAPHRDGDGGARLAGALGVPTGGVVRARDDDRRARLHRPRRGPRRAGRRAADAR